MPTDLEEAPPQWSDTTEAPPKWEDSEPVPTWDESKPVDTKPSFLKRLFGTLGEMSAAQAEAHTATDEAQKASNERIYQFAQKPLVEMTPQAMLQLNPNLAFMGEAGAGVAEELASAVTEMSKPQNLALMAGAITQPELAAGYFGVEGAKTAGQAAGEASVAFQQGDTREAAKLGTRAVLGAVQALAPVAMSLPKGTEVPPRIDAMEGATIKLAPAESVPPIIPSTAEASTSLKLGILPPGAAEGLQAVKDTAAKLDTTRQGFAREFTTSEIKGDIVRTLDAADNEARIEGQQIGNKVRLEVPDPLEREAITFMVEANGDKARLDDFIQQVEGLDSRATKALKYAQANWTKLEPTAELVSKLHDEQLRYEQENGVDPGEVEGYVRHAYDMDAMIGKGRPVMVSNPKGGVNISTSFKKQRAFNTYADAIEAGFKPRTFDVADLVQSRITVGERLVNRMKWADSFKDILDPVEEKPIVQPMITQEKGTQVPPMGYVAQDLMPGTRVAVHEGYSDLFDSLLGKSRVTNSQIGRLALQTEQGIKHAVLAIDTFHAGRMLYKELAMTHTLKGHDLGRSLLEYGDEDLVSAVKGGEITEEAAQWAKVNRPDAQLLISNGLNVGRVADALYKDTASQIPIWGKVVAPTTKWIFDKLTRGAMLHSAVMELDRLRTAKPDMPVEQIAKTVSKDINEYYGNLGRQGVFKDPTWQDVARLVFLAPQWVEGMARTEVGAAREFAQLPVEALRGQGLTLGPLAKGVGTGVFASFVANQLINLTTRGHPTWENPEHGHQLDAYIPSWSGNSPGFFLNPLSVFAELTHDAMRYYEDDPHALKVAGRIVNNKLAPLARAEEVLRTGKDYLGRDLTSTWDRVKEAGRALVPVPIPAQSALPWSASQPPDAGERRLFSMAGIKVEPAPSADNQLYSLARRFKEANNLKVETTEPSEYKDLNNALRKHDMDEAKAAYDKLVASGKSAETIRNHYTRLLSTLYTGTRHNEAAFRNSLNEDQRVLFQKAREERADLRNRFFEMSTKPKE